MTGGCGAGCRAQTPLRQFKGIQPDVLTRMEKKDLAWERYYDLSAQELGELIRLPKVGKALHRYVHQFPRLELAAHVQPITRAVLKARPRCRALPLSLVCAPLGGAAPRHALGPCLELAAHVQPNTSAAPHCDWLCELPLSACC